MLLGSFHVYSTRYTFMPTGYTPIYQIKKDGLDITGQFNDRTTSIQCDFDCGGAAGDTATIVLDDRDWAIARPNVGDQLQIWLGYAEVGLAYMNSYEVTELVFSLTPKAILLKLASTGQRSLYKSQTTQKFEGKTLGEIAAALAGKGGIQALVHPKVADIKVPFRNMTTSPQQLITELERQFGLVMKVVDGKLVAVPRDGGESASGQTMPIVVLGPEHFGTLSVRHTSRTSYSHVVAGYVDSDHVTQFEKSSLPPIAGITDIPYVIERKFNSQAEAQAAAKAQAQALQRSLGDADLQLSKGDPWIRDQQRILIHQTRDGMDGSYVAEMVSHSYVKEQGILTSIKARPDANGADYEAQFSEASDAQKSALFLVPQNGGIVGSLFALGGTAAAAATVGDIVNGISPFARQ